MRRIRGFVDLIFDVVEEATNLAERTHDGVVERSVRRFAPVEPAKSTAKAVTGLQTTISKGVFESIRLVNEVTRTTVSSIADIAEAGVENSFEEGAPELATPIHSSAGGTPSWYVDYMQATLNGLWGDYLNRKNSRLDLGMTIRDHGRNLPMTPEAFAAAFPGATNKVCFFVHGLAATEWLWSLSSHKHYDDTGVTFGTRLHDDLGYTPVYLRYNTGLHISENGKALAQLITKVRELYPVPIEEIVLVGHSMGGLVCRSAAHYGREHAHRWVEHLRHVVCIGSPHLGAPMEKAVHLLTGALRKVDAAGTKVTAELLDARSEGIKDLRYGYTIDEEWAGRDPDEMFADARRDVALVDGVGYYFLAATISRDPEHPLGQLLGDLLVRLPSASGEAPEPARRIHFTSGKVVPGMHHVHIVNHPGVYDALRDFLAA